MKNFEEKLEQVINNHNAGLLLTDFGKDIHKMSFLQPDCLAKDILSAVAEIVQEIIGKWENETYSHWIESEDGGKNLFKLNVVRNELRKEQRKKAISYGLGIDRLEPTPEEKKIVQEVQEWRKEKKGKA